MALSSETDMAVKKRSRRARAAVLALLGLLAVPSLKAQFTAEEVAERPFWEAFLREAEIVGRQAIGRDQGVTRPWKLILRHQGRVGFALWKNPTGIRAGYLEGWTYEIAAYLVDKLLGLHMVPPTVERDFFGYVGSCQLWIDGTSRYNDLLIAGRERDREAFRSEPWRKAGYAAQLFDNLIGNQDRHLANILVTPDHRAILIDHSRAFRTTRDFVEKLPFSERTVPAGELMRKLPRAVWQRVSALTEEELKEAVGPWLTAEEVRAVMARKRLLVAEVKRIIARYGEEDVLYGPDRRP